MSSDFGTWLQTRNLQAIGTRVSVGEECSIIIDDGAATEDVTVPIRFWNIANNLNFRFFVRSYLNVRLRFYNLAAFARLTSASSGNSNSVFSISAIKAP